MTYYGLRYTHDGRQLDVDSPFFEFNEAGHLQLADALGEAYPKYPMLQRLRDPYKDARFHANEIAQLIAQSSELMAAIDSPLVVDELTRFVDTLRQLLGKTDNLFFFGD